MNYLASFASRIASRRLVSFRGSAAFAKEEGAEKKKKGREEKRERERKKEEKSEKRTPHRREL